MDDMRHSLQGDCDADNEQAEEDFHDGVQAIVRAVGRRCFVAATIVLLLLIDADGVMV